MNNFDNVNCLGVECRKDANTQGDCCRSLEKGPDCIDNVIPSDLPEHNALKDAVKGKGSVAACAEVRRTLAGNKKYLVVLKTKKSEEDEGGFEIYLFSLANGLYNKMGPYPTLDSALSRADCFGLFEVKMSKNEETRIREAVGDYLYDDEDGIPVYDGGVEDFDGGECDDFVYDGEMEDGFDPNINGIENAQEAMWMDEYEDDLADTGIPVYKRGIRKDSDRLSDEYLDMIASDGDELTDKNHNTFVAADVGPETVDYDPLEESKQQLFDKLLNE